VLFLLSCRNCSLFCCRLSSDFVVVGVPMCLLCPYMLLGVLDFLWAFLDIDLKFRLSLSLLIRGSSFRIS